LVSQWIEVNYTWNQLSPAVFNNSIANLPFEYQYSGTVKLDANGNFSLTLPVTMTSVCGIKITMQVSISWNYSTSSFTVGYTDIKISGKLYSDMFAVPVTESYTYTANSISYERNVVFRSTFAKLYNDMKSAIMITGLTCSAVEIYNPSTKIINVNYLALK
jgi:hypothetical protein